MALLNQDKVDWEKLKLTISNVQQIWSFLSAENKDSKMVAILSSMDLSLVDVLENNI